MPLGETLCLINLKCVYFCVGGGGGGFCCCLYVLNKYIGYSLSKVFFFFFFF